MRGSKILASANPKGTFIEGPLTIPANTSLYPGIILEIDPNYAENNGRVSWRVYQPGTTGTKALQCVLMENMTSGGTYQTPYANATNAAVQVWAYMYIPLPGEQMNMQVESGTGTGTGTGVPVVAIGDKLEVVTGTGTLVEKGTDTPGDQPFIACEAVTAVTYTDLSGGNRTLALVMRN